MNKHLIHLSLVSALTLGCASLPAQSSEPVEIIFRADGKEITVRVKGDDTEVRVDGKKVTDERAKKSGNTLTINDETGAPLAFVSRQGQSLSFTRQPRSNRAAIGINVGSMPRALAEHLDLTESDVIYVTGATKGGAAAKAGIEAHDIILEIDGEAPVSERKLREILAQKKPGAKIDLTILRKGKQRDVTVQCGRAGSVYYPSLLSPFTAGVTRPTFSQNPLAQSVYGYTDLAKRSQNQQKSAEAFQSAIKALQDVQKKHLEHSKDKKAIGEFRKAIDSLKKANTNHLEAYNSLLNRAPTSFQPWLFDVTKGNAQVYPGNAWPGLTFAYHNLLNKAKGKEAKGKADLFNVQNMSNANKSVRRSPSTKSLHEQLDALQKRFDRLEKMLEKLHDQKKIR